MALVNLDHAQFWDPLSNSFLHKQYATSSNSMSKSTYKPSSGSQPALLHHEAGMFKRNDQSTSMIAPAQHQAHDFITRAQGRDRDTNRYNDETDDDLPPIKEFWDQISCKEISTSGYYNSEDTPQDLKNPIDNTSGSHPSLIHSKLDDGTGDDQGTQDKSVILEDNESNSSNLKAATFGLSKPTNPSAHKLWFEVEDQRVVEEDLCPYPPIEQKSIASTPIPAQDQRHSCHHSLESPQDQISNDRTMPSVFKESTPRTLHALLSKNVEGGWEEGNVSRPNQDLLLAFEEQDNMLLALASAPAPSSPRLWRHSIEPSHPQIDGPRTVRLEELRHSSPLQSQDRGKEPQEQQPQEVAAEAMREDDDDKELEQEGEKRQGAKEMTRSDMYQSEDSNHSHQTNEKNAKYDEDDEDPLPAKRRKRPQIPTHQCLTAPYDHNLGPHLGRRHSVTPSLTMRPEIDESPSPGPLTSVDIDYYNTLQTSCTTPIMQYQERPFQGFLKYTTIDNQTTYNLEFTLPCTSDLSLYSEILGSVSKSPAQAAVSHRVISKRKPGRELTKQQESLLAKMVHDDQTWAEIGRHFPGHTLVSLKENFFMKQGGQPRKRGRKAGVRASRYVNED